MDKLRTMMNGNGGLAVAAVVVAFLFVLAAWMPVGRDIGVPQGDASQTSSTDAVPPANSAPDQPEQPLASEALLPAPKFDEVRREPDGTTVIAARAAPGSDVAVIVNGKEIARAKADPSGAVAALVQMPDFDSAQVIELRQITPEGGETLSDDNVILTPRLKAAVTDLAATTDTGAAASEDVAAADPDLVEQVVQGDTPLANTSPDDPVTEPVDPDVQQSAVLKTNKDGVELLLPTSPGVVDNLALDTISYSDIGEVQLAGRAQNQSRQVRVYLDNTSIATLPVDDAGRWRGDLPDVDEGVYTLRVDELDADGAVTSRVETPFKRENPAVLAAATLDGDGPVKAITVQKGATLWAIARARYGDGTLYVRVFEANTGAIRDPDLIYPGQVFDLPD